MNRRAFITLLGGAAAAPAMLWPLAARARPPGDGGGLELIRRPVDLIATFGTPPTQAAQAATTTIPIVMIGIGDAVQAVLVASLARPGGNITGNTILSPDLGGKRLQFLGEAIASVSRVAYFANPDNASAMATLAEMKRAAASAGMTLIGVEVGSATDFDDALHRHAA